MPGAECLCFHLPGSPAHCCGTMACNECRGIARIQELVTGRHVRDPPLPYQGNVNVRIPNTPTNTTVDHRWSFNAAQYSPRFKWLLSCFSWVGRENERLPIPACLAVGEPFAKRVYKWLVGWSTSLNATVLERDVEPLNWDEPRFSRMAIVALDQEGYMLADVEINALHSTEQPDFCLRLWVSIQVFRYEVLEDIPPYWWKGKWNYKRRSEEKMATDDEKCLALCMGTHGRLRHGDGTYADGPDQGKNRGSHVHLLNKDLLQAVLFYYHVNGFKMECENDVVEHLGRKTRLVDPNPLGSVPYLHWY